MAKIMCGIAGVFNLNKEVFYEDYKSFKSLSYRGPEGNNFKKLKKFNFSHNKLAIIGDNLKITAHLLILLTSCNHERRYIYI